MKSFPPKDQAVWIGAAVAAVLILAAGLFLYQPIRTYITLKMEWNRLQREGMTPSRLDQMNRGIQSLEAEITAIEERMARAGVGTREKMLPGFVRHLEVLANEERVSVTTLNPGPIREEDLFIHTPFQTVVRGPSPALQRFLYRLEKSQPPVRVENAVLAAGREDSLDLTLSLSLPSLKNQPDSLSDNRSAPASFRSPAYENAFQGETRNLFSYRLPGQRTAASSQRNPDPMKSGHLTAIFFDGPHSMALVDGVLLRKGDSYQGYEIIGIEANRVLLSDHQKTFAWSLRGR
jgi:hypothetical protein